MYFFTYTVCWSFLQLNNITFTKKQKKKKKGPKSDLGQARFKKD